MDNQFLNYSFSNLTNPIEIAYSERMRFIVCHFVPLFLLFVGAPSVLSIGESQAAIRELAGVPSDSDEPTLDLTEIQTPEEPALSFCAEWNPEFSNNGHRCCASKILRRRSKKGGRCDRKRLRNNYCGEMTPEQIEYSEKAKRGELGDLLELINQEYGKSGDQAYCSVNNGFLAHGRRLIPTASNRIAQRTPQRCLDFGTDAMIGMLEWTGHQIDRRFQDPDYSRVKLVIGDMSAPRGGCLWGKRGRRGHASHTNGEDADVGFLTVSKGRESPHEFHKKFDADENWWLIRTLFENPFGCVKVIFLDHRHISRLAKKAQNDPLWPQVRRLIRHMPGHRNHLHVRVGAGPGLPGCSVADEGGGSGVEEAAEEGTD